MLTNTEAKLVAHLLRRAADVFSVRGCSDLNLTDVLGDTQDAKLLLQDYNLWARARDVTREDDPGPVVDDWLVMRWLASRVEP